MPQRGAGNQGDLERRLAGLLHHRDRHSLGVARSGEAAHANDHAVFDEACGRLGGGDLAQERFAADTVFDHDDLEGLAANGNVG